MVAINFSISLIEHHIELEAWKLNPGILLDVSRGIVQSHLCSWPSNLVLLEKPSNFDWLRIEAVTLPQANLGVLEPKPFVSNLFKPCFEFMESLILLHEDRLLALLCYLLRF